MNLPHITKKLVSPLLGMLKMQVYGKPLIFWLSKNLLTANDIIELNYLSFTNGLPKPLLVRNSQISVLLRSFNVIKSNGKHENIYERFLNNYFSNSQHFESQFLQDCFVDTLFKNKTNGVFIEIGVGEGKRISNTYFLEKQRNWEGLLCEPSLRYHESIQGFRTANLVKNAVTNVAGEKIRFAEVIGDGEHSTILQYLEADGHIRKEYKEYDVTTTTLKDVLKSNLPDKKVIDYISIDTEGSELGVLQGIDFGEITIQCISVEHNNEMAKLDQIRALLKQQKYVEVGMGIFSDDVFFVKEELINN
jgi:FkbM family methyltransferase